MKSTTTISLQSSFAAISMAAMVLFATGFSSAIADKASRSSAKTERRVNSPIGTALTNSLNALERADKQNASRPTQRVQNGADTSRKETRIISVRTSADVITVRMELAEDDNSLDLGIYNMLGKKVMDIYHGTTFKGPRDFSGSISDLPEGVYICIAQGDGFRKAEKFYRSR